MKKGKAVRENRDRKDKRRYGSHGIITVFVTLMMVPVVAITGIMVDIARLKMYSSQAVMAADTYGEAVLSEYDNVLKELYGLFSVTQNEEGKAAIDELNKYMGYSFNPNGDSKGISGFVPYGKADVKLEYENVDGATLYNNNVLETQIADFMKFRVINELGDGFELLEALEKIQEAANDMAAVKSRNELTKSGSKVLKLINEYYKKLDELKDYTSFLTGRENAFSSYSKEMDDIAKSEDYDDYCYYLKNKDTTIKDALDHAKRIEDAKAAADNPDDVEDELTDDEEELVEKYENYDKDSYVNGITERLNVKQGGAEDNESEPIDFDNAEDVIKEIDDKAKKIKKELDELKGKIEDLRGKLNSCSDDIKANIEEEIADLEEITNHADDFQETYDLIEETNHDIKKNEDNKKEMEEETKKLNEVKEKILKGEWTPGTSVEPAKIVFVWYDFRKDKEEFFKLLEKMCKTGKSEGDTSQEKIDKANSAGESAKNEIEGEEEDAGVRDISEAIAGELRTGETDKAEVPGMWDFFAGGLSFETTGDPITNILDKFMVVVYDFGMFSSRVTGVEPPDDSEGGEDDGDSQEEYADYSLTKIKMSGDINYLYGAELEYILGGHTESQKNLNEARNIICGVRLSLNFITSYKVKEVNDIIKKIADMAAEAAAGTGVGAAFAPLVRVTVSGALRLAFATIETVMDWQMLMEREGVIFLKSKLGDLNSIDKINGLLGTSFGSGESESEDLELTYENYMFILLALFVNNNTLLNRTADLITLNVNQASRQEKGTDLPTPLKFKMQDTVTAVKATCKVKADFVVVPENIMEMYLKDTKTKTIIELQENKYFGYSVIRGY